MATFAYYQVEAFPATVLEMYHDFLYEFDLHKVKQAFMKHIETSNWFPKIAELKKLLEQHTPKIESIADQQAALVVATIRNYGYRHSPVWEDPITAHLFTHRFNFKALCATLTESETKWFIKEFKEAYQAANDMCDGDVKQLGAPPELLKLASGIFKSIN